MADVKSGQKVKKKKWYGIHSAGFFNNAFIGESLVAEPSVLQNKAISVNLATLTGDLRQQNVTLNFRVTNVAENKGSAQLVGYGMSAAAVKRLVHRRSNRVDGTVAVTTKDGINLTMKPLMLTLNATHKGVTQALRKLASEKLVEEAAKQTYQEFVQSILSRGLQQGIKKGLNKTYPIKTVEIRAFKVTGGEEKSA